MRIKLNITHDFEGRKLTGEWNASKMLYFVEDAETKNKKLQDPFTIKDLLKDVRKKLGLRDVEASAEIDGYFLPNDIQANQILKDGDIVGLRFKSKCIDLSSSDTQSLELQTGSQLKRKPEEDVEIKKKAKSNPKKVPKAPEERNPSTVPDTKKNGTEIKNPNVGLSKSQKRHLRRKRLAETKFLKPNEVESSPPQACEPKITRVDVNKPSPQAEGINANTEKRAKQTIKQETFDSVTDYSALPLVDLGSAPPIIDGWIAYKIIELGPDYCPSLSDFKHAKVLAYDADTETISLQVAQTPVDAQYDEYGEPILRRFEPPSSFTTLENGVEVEYLTHEVEATTVVPFSVLEDPRHLPW